MKIEKDPSDARLEERLTDLASGSLQNLLGKSTGKALLLASQIAFARILGPYAFGLYSLGWTLFRVFHLLGTLGLGKAAIRFGSSSSTRATTVVVTRTLVLAVALGSGVGIAAFVGAPFLATTVFGDPALIGPFRVFSLLVPISAVLTVAAQATQISETMRWALMAEDLTVPAMLLVTFLGTLTFLPPLSAALAGTLAGYVLGALLALGFARHLFEGFPSLLATRTDAPGFYSLLAFAVPTALAGLFATVVKWVDRLMLGMLASTGDVGVYQAASQIPSIYVVVLASLNAMFAPMMVRAYSRGQLDEVEHLFQASVRWGIYLGLPVLILSLTVPTEIMTLLFGSAYGDASLPFAILSSSQFANLASGAVGLLLVMSDQHRLWLIITFLGLLFNIGVNLLLIPMFGTTGAAIGTGTTLMLVFAGGVAAVRMRLGLWGHEAGLTKAAAISAVAALGGAGAGLLGNGEAAITLFLTMAASLPIYFVLLYRFGLSQQDRVLLDRAARLILRDN